MEGVYLPEPADKNATGCFKTDTPFLGGVMNFLFSSSDGDRATW